MRMRTHVPQLNYEAAVEEVYLHLANGHSMRTAAQALMQVRLNSNSSIFAIFCLPCSLKLVMIDIILTSATGSPDVHMHVYEILPAAVTAQIAIATFVDVTFLIAHDLRRFCGFRNRQSSQDAASAYGVQQDNVSVLVLGGLQA